MQHQWVEKSSERGFTVCAESPRPTVLLPEGHPLSVSYASWAIGQKSPWKDSTTGVVELNAAWGNGVSHCKKVVFKKKFDARPLVFGSVDRRQLVPDGDERIGHWIDNISPTSFTVCMRGRFAAAEKYNFP